MRDGGKEMQRKEEGSILLQPNSLGNSEKQPRKIISYSLFANACLERDADSSDISWCR